MVTFPRRWGKTFNLNVIKAFFETELDPLGRPLPEDLCINRKLFEMGTFGSDGLKTRMKIMEKKEIVARHFGKYIVLKLDLQNIEGDYEHLFYCLSERICNLYKSFMFLQLLVPPQDAQVIKQGMECSSEPMTGKSVAFLKDSLLMLSKILHNHYQKEIIILVDEYDCPSNNIIQQITDPGERTQAIHLFKSMTKLIRFVIATIFLAGLFSNAIKNNSCVTFAMLTGILRLGKDMSLSPLNNLQEFNLSRSNFTPYYGFTQNEVEQLFARFRFSAEYLNEVKKMYNGYKFNTTFSVYNPWSLANCLNRSITNRFDGRGSFGSDEASSTLISYWTESGSIKHFVPLLFNSYVLDKFGQLLGTDNPTTTFTFVESLGEKEMSVLQDLLIKSQSGDLEELKENQIGILFTFLCYTGYFSIESIEGSAYTVSLPNIEVKTEISKLVSLAVENSKHSQRAFAVKECLLKFIQTHTQLDSLDQFGRQLKTTLYDFISSLPRFASFEQKGPVDDKPYVYGNENIIQCLLASILVSINVVRLNCVGSEVQLRGRMRGDIFVTYKELAIIVELKYDQTAIKAMQQIHDNRYTENVENKFECICLIGINVNSNKDVSVILEYNVSFLVVFKLKYSI